ncbi:IclR family transcriptional regulator [Agrobacterium sp. LAD9]|uniref:IclR family transcriptional regulator n=1 Tax=Agrobacterium sp. LAD9 TaxID=2055153 RepID=UPI000D1D7635|nr:IclR family transcriptional regulator [Agrobacterium sp. LAD9]
MRKRQTAIEFGPRTQDDHRFVEALARGLSVLRAFRHGDTDLSNQDFVERTGLAKATVSRLTFTLTRLGYLSYSLKTGRYRLEAPVMALGYTYLAELGIKRLAKPLMQELSDYAGLPVALGARDHMSMIYVECCRSSDAITLSIEVGAHIKMGSSALGRAYIAGLSQSDRTTLLEELSEHEGANWSSVEAGILEALETYNNHGYCLSVGNWKRDVNSVGVPYRPPDGSPPLAFNCGGAAFLLDQKKLIDDIAPRLVELVKRLETSQLAI